MNNVVGFNANRDAVKLEQRVRQLAKDTKNIHFTGHAVERMQEREIANYEIVNVLRSGFLESHRNGKKSDEIVCKMVKTRHGSNRDLGVVTAVIRDSKLIIVTVEYEDAIGRG